MSLFRCAISAARPALFARSALRSSASSSLRAFSTTLRASSDHGAKPPSLFGPGGKTGEVPTDFEQATGLERLELLGEMEGIDVFDETPLDSSRVGTKKDPISVLSYSPERIIGCTGCPADSHDIQWFILDRTRQRFCVECGSVYQMDYQGVEEEEHHH
ncbi:cytochrome c oxidase subunit VB-domain-containing protein [Mycena rosella]|uniref:Cytochrome c oxidase subunit 4, mitochondrial n=1 Tax=Mycena rosella TaxID=1033263 RepID=A0AAD7GXX6_MYCRO|nr:cytochrome c oxidase subunit VB-domain-containing protein [Mycena rosella]